MNTTKEGIEVLPGQTWKELDKRSNRVCTVLEVSGGFATMKSKAGVVSKVAVKRMYKHSSGWRLC